MDITAQFPDLFDGVGKSSSEDLDLLVKALEAQEGVTDIASLKDTGALQPQSLETQLALLVPQERHLTLYKDMPKGPAKSTLEEYTVMNGYGQEASWSAQMETPLEADPNFKRKFAVIKFLRALWRVADVAAQVQTIREPEVIAKQAATMRVLRTLNNTLYDGDSALVPEQIDGFQKIIEGNGSSAHVQDQRGAALGIGVFHNMAELIMANQGNPDGMNLYMSPGAMTSVSAMLQNTSSAANNNVARILQATVGADGQVGVGYGVSHVFTPFGRLNLKSDIFLAGLYEAHGAPKILSASDSETITEGATSIRAPSTPTAVAATVAPTVAGSQWKASGETRLKDTVTGFKYRVYAVNAYGRSAASVETSAATVDTAGKITITITPGSGGFPATGFVVLGEMVAGQGALTGYHKIGTIAANGSTPVVFSDLNATFPGHATIFGLDLTSVGEFRTFVLKQLAPLHSVEFARIGMFRHGVVNLYTQLVPYAPLRGVLIKNVPVGTLSANPKLLL